MPANRPRHKINISLWRTKTPIFAALMLLFLSTSVPGQDNNVSFYNELILEVLLKNTSLDQDLLGFQQDDEIFLSLTELTSVLQFPISVNAGEGRASGWFINEEREFALDLTSGEAIVNGEVYNLLENQYLVEFDDLFISTEALEEWFPLKLDANLQRLQLNVETLETIPLESQLFRSSRTMAPRFSRRAPEMPLADSPYQLFGHRGTDARITTTSSRRDDDAETERNANFSLLSRGDLAWMTSTIFAAGDEEDITGARLTLERSEFDGPLGLNHVEVGDVVSTVGSGNRGAGVRGGTVNRSATGRYADDTIDLEGDILPGWQVELYRNGLLLDFQEVGDDGRYQFIDVPLIFGENNFEFVFYGPFGEVRREKVTHFVGTGALGAGKVAYEFSATQAGRSVFDLNQGLGSEADTDSAIYNGTFNVGITRNLSAGISSRSFEVQEERYEDYSANLNLSTSYFQLKTSYDDNATDLNRASAALRTRISDVSLTAEYSEFDDDGLEPQFINDNPALWSSSLSMQVNNKLIPFSLSSAYSKRKETESASAVISGTHALGAGSRLSSNLGHSWVDARKSGGEFARSTSGSTSISVIADPWLIRGAISYGIDPDSEFQSAEVSGNLDLNDDISLSGNIQHDFRLDLTRLRAGYNWDLEYVRISPQLAYDTDERFFGILSISTNFATRPGQITPIFSSLPLSNSGGVMARAFIDENGDGNFSPATESPASGVSIVAPQSFRKATTNTSGQAYLPRLPSYRQTDVVMDTQTLPDAELQPTREGNSVMPRPGHWQVIDFPVITTADLEGRAEIAGNGGTRSPISRRVVSLTDSDGRVFRSQRTTYDGVFVFSRVPPGKYELTLTTSGNEKVIKAPGPLDITSKSGVLTNLNFLVSTTDQQTAIVSYEDRFAASAQSVVTEEPLPIDEEDLTTPKLPQQPAGEWLVQVGAFSSTASAEDAWSALKSRTPSLNELAAVFEPVNTLTRVSAGPGMREQDARALCQDLKSQGIDCLVRRQAP